MATYGDEYHASLTYASANGSENYASWAGYERPPSMWSDLIGTDPTATAMLNKDPVFFDALYEARMLTNYQNVSWFSGDNILRRHARGGVKTGTGLAKCEYTEYLGGINFKAFTVLFVFESVTTAAIYPNVKTIFTLHNGLEHLAVQITDLDGPGVGLVADANFGYQYDTGSLTEATKSGSKILNDNWPHLVALTMEQKDDGTTSLALNIDGIDVSAMTLLSTNFSGISKFVVGPDLPSQTSANSVEDVTFSHLAIYNRRLATSELEAMNANLRIPAEAGYFALVEGRWRPFLI